MKNEKLKVIKPVKKKAGDAIAKIVGSQIWKMLIEQFRSVLEDKDKWEELRLKLLTLIDNKKLPPE